MIEIYKKTLLSKELRKIKKEESGSWIRITSPDKDELKDFLIEHKLDEDILEDALDDNETPRIDFEREATYIVVNVTTEEEGHIVTRPLTIILTERFFITISKSPFKQIERIIRKPDDIFTTQKVKFLIQLFMAISESYETNINKISKELKSKKYNLKKLTEDDIIRLVELEEVLNDFISSFGPTIRIFHRLLGGRKLSLFKEDKEYIEDLIVDSEQTLDMCKTNVKTIANIRQAYSTVLTNNLNKVIRLLTVLTIMLTVPTIVSSIYGMNVDLPFQDNPLAFAIVIGFTAITLLLLLVLVRLKKWL